MMGLLHSGKYACCRVGTGRLTSVDMALKLLNSPTWGRQLVGLLGVGDRPGSGGAGGLGDGLAEILALLEAGPEQPLRSTVRPGLLLALFLELSPTLTAGRHPYKTSRTTPK